MTPSRWELDNAMRQVLAELCTLSHGTTTSWNPGGGGNDGDGGPPGELHPPQDQWARRYAKANDDAARQRAIDGARDELRLWRGQYQRATPVGETLEQRNARIRKEGAGFPPRIVAVRFHCAERDVINARIAEGLDGSTGLATTRPTTAATRDAEIRRLKNDGGLTQRQIALTLGVSVGTVNSVLKGAAA